MRLILLLEIALLSTSPATIAAAEAATAPRFTPEQLAFFKNEVQPLLTQHCRKCHGDDPKKLRGGLDLTHREGLLRGGDSGPAVDLAKPAASLLLKAIRYEDDAYQMPPNGKLPPQAIATLTRWVEAGLPWTPDSEKKPTPRTEVSRGPDRSYWAYQPVRRPAIPPVQDQGWILTPIDAFIRNKQEARGIVPVRVADRASLCRRAYYDLTGLPPTPEQLDAFLADPSPDAFSRLVDQLLESPHYGEKWGRAWLDLVRYAETNGFERDGPKPNVWRYRDYVIRSFNADKPYDQFIKEQLAGDELAPDRPEAMIATGYYRLGLWDDEPADPKQAIFDGFDDIITVTGQVMLGMTLNCCRCHEHKGDHFPQADYYKFLAFFRDLRPFSDTRNVISPNNQTDITPLELRRKYEKELQERQQKIMQLEAAMKPIEDRVIATMSPQDQLAVQDGKREEIVRKVPDLLKDQEREAYLALRKQRDDLKRLPSPAREFALCVANCDPRPPATQILIRGNPHAPGAAVTPGFPTVLGFPDPVIPEPPAGAKTSGRRSILAHWIASPNNPLTARVLVNRLWQHHFGRGLVPTPNDFGKLGEPPSHPELLDWLAAEFVEPTWNANQATPWTLKRMHRLMMLSRVYQLSVDDHPQNRSLDPANILRWRFNLRRLTAEEVRDSILAVCGTLNPTMFGPSVYPKMPADILAGQSVPGQGWPTSPPHEANRRSIYVAVKRSLPLPILLMHDQADSENTCPVRYTTTVPTQALGMLNGEFLQEQANAFAERLRKEQPGNLATQVTRAIRLTTGRQPSPREIAQDVEFIQRLQKEHRLSESAALARYTLLILNTNEFLYLD
jgi:hypothetical protein